MVKGYQSKRDKVCSEFYDTTKNKIRQPRNVVQRKTMDIMLGYKVSLIFIFNIRGDIKQVFGVLFKSITIKIDTSSLYRYGYI